jgi:hypothetical protein
MKYDQIKELLEEQFRRLTGVKKATFKKMLGILREADEKKKAKGARKSKLSVEDQLLTHLTQNEQNEEARVFEKSINSKSAAIFY